MALQRRKEQRENITFARYAEGFWKKDAPFATDRAAHGRTVSNGYLDIAEGYTRNHLLPAHYAINVLAATTGIRMGEVRALLVENVKPDHVEIRRSWEQGYGPRPPKADSVRDVPISPKVSAILAKVIEETQPTGLMFYGRGDMDTPMSKGVIEKHLRLALCTIGIPEPPGLAVVG